jgi:hypothetical protein
MPARDQHPEARAAGFAALHVEGVAVQGSPRSVLQQALELRLLPQPARAVQAEALAGRD